MWCTSAVDVYSSPTRMKACSRRKLNIRGLCHLQVAPVPSGLKSTAVFDELKRYISSNPDLVRKVKAIYHWNITKDGKTTAKWSKCF